MMDVALCVGSVPCLRGKELNSEGYTEHCVLDWRPAPYTENAFISTKVSDSEKPIIENN